MNLVNENTVFLRPQPSAAPVDYIREQRKSGMVMMASRNLAIYTCKEGANVGPQGPPGSSDLDTIIASAGPEYTAMQVDLVQPATHFRQPFPSTLSFARCSLSVPSEGLPIIIDLHMNGVSIFDPTRMLQIDAGSKTSVGSALPPIYNITAIPDDAEWQVYIVQVGNIVAGAGPKVAITGYKVVQP